MRRVFISYASADETYARQIAAILDAEGIEYFFDKKDVNWGANVPQEISNAISECSELVVIISPASVKSQWVPFEIGGASALGKRILPYLTHPSITLPAFIQQYHYKTSLDDIKGYFATDSALSEAPPKDAKEFEQWLVKFGLSSMVKQYADRFKAGQTPAEKAAVRKELLEKLTKYQKMCEMPDALFGVYVDQCIEQEKFITAGDFILLTNKQLRKDQFIEKYGREIAQELANWLYAYGLQITEAKNGKPEDQPNNSLQPTPEAGRG